MSVIIDINEEQAAAIHLLGWWMSCIDAGREIDGDERLSDDYVLLHTVAHAATAIVTLGHIRAIGAIKTSDS